MTASTPEIDDGGPAFPVSTGHAADGHQDSAMTWQFPGMALRDHFAGIALISQANTPWRDRGFVAVNGKTPMENEAICAYQQADAMLKARKS